MPHPGYDGFGLPPTNHGRRRGDSPFRDFFREIPTSIKVLWLVGALISASVTGFVLWLLYTLVMHVAG